MAGIILLEAVESLQQTPTKQSHSQIERGLSLVDLGKKLLESARLGDTEEVRNLMTNGAPFTTDWLGTSPLHMAAQHGHLSTAEVLIRAGISRDARTKVDRTPLHVAAQEGHVEIVDLLLKNGADVDAKDMLKMTPLHWAVERGHVDVIALLLGHGADIHATSKFEKTPVTVAVDKARIDIVHLLTSSESCRGRLLLDDADEEAAASVELLNASKADELLSTEEGESADAVSLDAVQSNSGESSVPASIRSIPLHSNVAKIKHEVAKGSVTEVAEASENSGPSTSVLATLATLAETIGPLTAQAGNSVSTAETLQWLEQHGITMLPGDNSTIITSALEGGQTISLTEAGKLALNWNRKAPGTTNFSALNVANRSTEGTSPTLEQTLENVVASMGANQKVITIVTDQSHLPSIVSGGTGGPIVVAMANPENDSSGKSADTEDCSEPLTKKMKKECVSSEVKQTKSAPSEDIESLDREQLARRLEEAQRKAKEYQEQLRIKENEAEEYRKRLEMMTRGGTKK